MVSKVVVRDLSAHRLSRINIKCVKCNFWFDYFRGNFLAEVLKIRSLSDIKCLLKRKFLRKDYVGGGSKKLVAFAEKGGIVKGAFKNRKCIGILIAGDYTIFPKLQSFRVFPPGPDSTFLGCIYVEPDERRSGVEKRLLIELEKYLLIKNIAAIETIGKRLDDDIDEEEFENSPLVPFKFLINNGFYLKKNDEQYPLLRLDLKSIARGFSREELSLEKVAYKKTARHPAIIREE